MWDRLLLPLSAVLVLLTACGSGTDGQRNTGAPEARRIIPYSVEFADNAREVQAVGTARARAAAAVRPETAGIVDAVLFKPGDFVAKGDALMQLEADDERLQVRLAEVAVREAEQLLARYRRIEDTGAVSDSAIDEARTQLEAAKINLEQARLRLAERTVIAPFEGYIGLTDIDAGGRVGQDTVIASIDDRRVLFIDFNVPEDVFGQLSAGKEVQATAFAEGDRPRTATVLSLDSRVNPDSRAFRVRAELDNSDDALRPGMSFEVRFDVPGRSYPVVPEAAIVWGSDGAYLWAVREGIAQQVPVQIVSRQEGRVLVDADLRKGTVIVAEGVQKVREGTPVTFDGMEESRPRGAIGSGTGSFGQ